MLIEKPFWGQIFFENVHKKFLFTNKPQIVGLRAGMHESDVRRNPCNRTPTI